MGSSTTPTSKNQKSPKKKRKPAGAQPEVELLDSVKWNEADGSIGPNLPGGFLSLEEIDESDYGFFDDLVGVPTVVSGEEGGLEEEVQEESGSGEKKGKTRREKQKEKKRKEKQKAKKRKAMEEKSDAPDKDTNGAKSVDVNEDVNESDAEGWVEDDSEVDESEFYAWKGLRLHPLLMKSICKLGFKEPTPIQKDCIPAAAHQGKDVVGAAETGSGKTLAFGIPILQRLLEEREKDSRLKEEGKAVENVKRKSPLRALIIAPTRELVLQVTDHLKKIANPANIHVVPIVGGMSMEKQLRCLEKGPEIIVGTPGRLWEHMSGGNQHLVQLHSLSFFVLDEADRMIESGHFHELASIIDLLPNGDNTNSAVSGSCNTVPNVQLKKRQTFVFSATVALSDNFRKKLKHKAVKPRSGMANELSSIEALSVRTGMKDNVAVVDLTKSSIVAEKLEESFIECTEENKEAYLYYILSVHGHGRTIVFCTSTAALRRISAFLRILEISCWTLHGGMQQRARLKAIDRFRVNEHAVLVATDVAARGLDIPGVRTVIHFQLPHTADFYIHRSGRTARASADGCCIALISPSDGAKFVSLCKSLSKDNLLQFPLNESYLPEILKRVSLARQIDKISHMNHKEKDKKNWVERNAQSIELMIEKSDSEEEVVRNHKMKKICSRQLQKLQQELKTDLAKPLTSKQFSGRFFTGVGVSSLMHQQLEELSKQKQGQMTSTNERRSKLVVIGQDCIEPLEALRSHGHEVNLNSGKQSEMRKLTDQRKRKRKQDKIHQRDERRKKRKMEKEA